jgi:hypothetical protein
MIDVFWNAVGCVLIAIGIAVPLAIVYLAVTEDDKNDTRERKD